LLDHLTYEQMQPLVGTIFHIDAEGRTVDLKLVRVGKVMESQAARLARHPFSLYFDGPRDIYLPQRIYRLQNAGLAEPLEIFLVPVAGAASGYTYEAVFA
jgi:hypothetical protein